MVWLYGSVRPYFLKQGINLLRDDMLFIEKCLSNVPQERHKIVMREYFRLWNDLPNGIEEKLNTGRFEANCYLREVCLYE